MNRQSRALLTILILAVLLLPVWLLRRADRRDGSPTGTRATAASTPARGGTLLASARSEPRSFNRYTSNQFPTEIFSLLTQAKLVRVNRASGALEPALAEKWATTDNIHYTFTLREGIKWSDGMPFTSADVTFSFEAAYLKDSMIASALVVGGKPLQVTSPDTRTVVVTFPEPLVPAVRLLDNLVILPRHKLEASVRNGTFAKAWSPATAPSEIAGLGPFRLSRYDPGQRLIYERNPNYWRTDERGTQLPYLDRIVLEIVPQQDAEIVRLRAGTIDLTQEQLRATDISTFTTLANQGKVQVHDLGVATDANPMVFNLRPQRWTNDPRAAWLTRKEFRQAISHAVDREAFANTVYLGAAVPIHGPISPGNREWFWPDIPRYLYSIDKSRALLGSLGLRNRDADEWLEDAAGNEARFALEIFSGASLIERSAEVIRDDLKKVGIAMDVVSLEPNTVIQHVNAGTFDAVLVALQMSDLDPAMNQDFWSSAGSSHLWNPEQKTPATDWERQIDMLMHQQAVTADEAERKHLFREVQRLFSENLPILYFAAPRIYIAVSPRITHMTPTLSRPQVLWNPETIAVAPGSDRPSS